MYLMSVGGSEQVHLDAQLSRFGFLRTCFHHSLHSFADLLDILAVTVTVMADGSFSRSGLAIPHAIVQSLDCEINS